MLRQEMAQSADSAENHGSEDNETPLPPPSGGYPWQLALCDVFQIKKMASRTTMYRVKCQLCDWGPKSPTTCARVKEHYGVFPESRHAVSDHCTPARSRQEGPKCVQGPVGGP